MSQPSDTERLLETLTAAERTVFLEALAGDSVKAVAHRLSLSEATVRSHLSAIYGKLQVEGRAQLIARHGPQSSGAAGREEPSRRRTTPRLLAVGGSVCVLVLLAVATYAVATGPRRVGLNELAGQVRDGNVSELRYHGSTVVAITPSGEIAADDVPIEEAIRLSELGSVAFSTSAYEPEWLGNVVLLFPIVILLAVTAAVLAVAWGVFRSRRPAGPNPTRQPE